jgi:hypothetical protein
MHCTIFQNLAFLDKILIYKKGITCYPGNPFLFREIFYEEQVAYIEEKITEGFQKVQSVK